MISVNGHIVVPTIFPDKTSQVWKLPTEVMESDVATVFWRFESEAEIMQLFQLKQLLDENCDQVFLHIHYLPYGRQDKKVSNYTTFALRTFALVINGMRFNSITCDDPHSEIAGGLIDNFLPMYPLEPIFEATVATASDINCYPDAGACKKYARILPARVYIYANKIRDQLTGEIKSYELVGDCKGKKVLIVDDICDFGRTFIGLSDLLKMNGAKEISLFVSHGLFTGGLDVLRAAGIKRIFTKEGEVL